MRGEVESTEPYVIKLTNTYDNDEVMQSQLNIDPERRSLLFTTNYDLGKGQRRGGGRERGPEQEDSSIISSMFLKVPDPLPGAVV